MDFTDDVVSSTLIFYFERDDIRFSINDTQGDTQGIDAIIIQESRKDPQITTEELAQIANKGIATIKRTSQNSLMLDMLAVAIVAIGK